MAPTIALARHVLKCSSWMITDARTDKQARTHARMHVQAAAQQDASMVQRQPKRANATRL